MTTWAWLIIVLISILTTAGVMKIDSINRVGRATTYLNDRHAKDVTEIRAAYVENRLLREEIARLRR